jgi:lysophospholipid acyltransferase (LPLAT)-like uncharacterized protein
MSDSRQKTRKVHRKPWLQYLVLFPFFLIYRLWQATLRLEVSEEDHQKMSARHAPQVFLFWHNHLFSVPIIQRRIRDNAPVYALISASKDGAWLEALFRLIGMRSVRGSANFRGAQALKDLVRVVRDGYDVGITPDGSKGPVHVAKVGAAALAKLSHTPLVLYGISYSASWRMNSWDQFHLPKPFSKLTLRVERIGNFDELGVDSVEQAAEILGQRLMALQDGK